MDTFSILQFCGWLAVGLVMYLFAVTGGFDLGAGMLTPFVGKNDNERRMVVNTVGPTWDGNQVWLITAGGAIFAIWPRVYAASFSGFYFGFLLVLWALFLRPVAFEYRSKLASLKWRKFWDWALCIGSFVPSLVIGVAIGNLFLGVPFQFQPETLRFFYGTGMTSAAAIHDLLALLSPFAVTVGLFCVCMMIMHGAAYLCMRTEGVVFERCKQVHKVSTILFILLFIGLGLWLIGIKGFIYHATSQNPMLHPLTSQVSVVAHGWFHNYTTYPWLIIAPLLGLLGAIWSLRVMKKDVHRTAFIGSSLAVLGVLGTLGFTLFPFIMPSITHPSQSLLAWNASSSEISLIGILIVAVIMLPVIFLYTNFVYKKVWGRGTRMSEKTIAEQAHVLY